jgi:hypothetical protein
VSQQRRLDKLSHGGGVAPSIQPATPETPGIQPEQVTLAPDAPRATAR